MRRTTASQTVIVRIVLLIVLASGAALRLSNLDAKTIRQYETYVPNINLPNDVSDPAPRKTLLATLTGSMWDVHPPTWYLAMWFWTKVFGTSLYALRFPSVLLGTLAIWLTFAVARLESDRLTALMAAAFVASNGLQLLWSQIARQYTWTCCFGLLAAWFLLLVIKRPERRTLWMSLYGGASFGGLISLYYYWPLFAAHMIWAVVAGPADARHRRELIRLQFLTVMLAAPILAMSVFQAKESYLGSDRLNFLADYVRFGFLSSGVGSLATQYGAAALLVLLAVAGFLLAMGLVQLKQPETSVGTSSDSSPAAPGFTWLALASVVTGVGMVGMAFVFGPYQPLKMKPVLATAIAPLLALAAAEWLNRGGWRHLDRFRIAPGLPLTSALATIPMTIVILVSLAIPFLAPKGALILTPYVLILIAAGVTETARSRVGVLAAGLIALLLVPAHTASIRDARANTGPQDYAGMAARWRPLLADGDIVFAKRDWSTTGVFYYLDVDRYRFVGDQFGAAIERLHPARVWVVWRPNLRGQEEVVRPLRQFVVTKTLPGAAGLTVDLYERRQD